MKKRAIITIGIILFIIIDIIVAIQILGNNMSIKSNKNEKNEKTNIVNNEGKITDKSSSSLKEVLGIQNITTTSSDLEKQVDNKNTTMNEGTRIKNYCAKYFDAIEFGEYDEAYEMLNDNFKAKYFNNKETFIEYAKRTYPTGTIVLQYKDVSQKGEIYEVKLSISDDDNKNYKAIEQTLVVRENSANDFKISFSIN